MIFSVWNQGKGVYDYYESPDPQAKLQTERPKHLKNRTLGSTVQQAAWPLPSNAVLSGQGPNAIGRVAIAQSSALGDVTIDISLTKVAMLALSGFLLWKYVVKAPRARARRRT